MKRLFCLIRGALRAASAACIALTASLSVAAPPAAEILDLTHANVRAVLAVQSAATPDLMKWPDVLGSAVGLNEAGQPALLVFVDRDGAAQADVVRALPPALGG